VRGLCGSSGRPIAQVARDLGINEGTLGHWYAQDRGQREGTSGLNVEDINELKRMRRLPRDRWLRVLTPVVSTWMASPGAHA
jgi:transposase-like protein